MPILSILCIILALTAQQAFGADTTAPAANAAAAQEDAAIRIIAGGDVMTSRHIGKLMAQSGADYPFKEMAPMLKKYDVVFANLESVLGDGNYTLEYPKKPYNFISPASVAGTLKKSGFTALNLANNHIMDYGSGALKETLAALDKEGIARFGAGANATEARTPAIIEVKGKKFAFLGYTLAHSADVYATDDKPGPALLTMKYIRRDIKAARKKADFVVVSLHWGIEYDKRPSKDEIKSAHDIIDAGADMILGHHPHVIRGVEAYKGRLIAYSLGNFLFDQKRDGTDVAMMVEADIDAASGRIKSARVVPLGKFSTYMPMPADKETEKKILAEVKALSDELVDKEKAASKEDDIIDWGEKTP